MELTQANLLICECVRHRAHRCVQCTFYLSGEGVAGVIAFVAQKKRSLLVACYKVGMSSKKL